MNSGPIMLARAAMSAVEATAGMAPDASLEQMGRAAEEAIDKVVDREITGTGPESEHVRMQAADEAWHLWFMDGIVTDMPELVMVAAVAHSPQRRIFASLLLRQHQSMQT